MSSICLENGWVVTEMNVVQDILGNIAISFERIIAVYISGWMRSGPKKTSWKKAVSKLFVNVPTFTVKI